MTTSPFSVVPAVNPGAENSSELAVRPPVAWGNGTESYSSSVLLSAATASTAPPDKVGFSGELDAFFYIIIVLSFYAISIAFLMIKYIRREREEISLDFYYTEYVNRTWFQRPDVQNQLAMKRERQWIRRVLMTEQVQAGGQEGRESGPVRVYRETDL